MNNKDKCCGKKRMIKAYRGEVQRQIPVAPELWYYYPAKLLKVDMMTFEKEIPFHEGLKNAFSYFDCEGWGALFIPVPHHEAKVSSDETWQDEKQSLLEKRKIQIRGHELTSVTKYTREEPSWMIEAPIKHLEEDLEPWLSYQLGGDISAIDTRMIEAGLKSVGDVYLLEGWLGFPFFDFYAMGREGTFVQAVYDFMELELQPMLKRLQQRYADYLVRLAEFLCEHTSFESFVLGCSWSTNSLIGPHLWRLWDKPVIAKVAETVHSYGKLLHVHFHGKSQETLNDFAEIGIDCVCPFERPPGGDIVGYNGLLEVFRKLGSKVTMNGNVHTVETLIRGKPEDVRREVREIRKAAEKEGAINRLIIGTGDQVGRETPEENIRAMIEEVRT